MKRFPQKGERFFCPPFAAVPAFRYLWNLQKPTAMWKDFFYFTRAQQAGIIALAVLLAVAIGVNVWQARVQHVPPGALAADTLFVQEVEAFKRTLQSRDSLERAERERLWAERRAKYKQHHADAEAEAYTLAPFDPNTADSLAFRKLGLPPWMAGNILKYRARGGRFRKADDFRKIYGLTAEKFDELKPYIRIAGAEAAVREQPDKPGNPPAVPPDTAFVVVELNAADTAELMKVAGIGPYYAREIVRYRRQLGGFYSVEQLREIERMRPEHYDRIAPHCTVDTTMIKRIEVNRAGIDFLRRHPYIDFYQARVICEFRRAKGRLDGMRDLRRFREFTGQDLQRLRPYLDFE